MKKILYFIIVTILISSIGIVYNPKSTLAEVIVVHANQAWQLTDIILKKNHTISWHVKPDDWWSFNTEMFPDGHNADGIPVPALESYTLPGERIGMLLGKTNDDRIISMGSSGSRSVMPGEEGCYLYLSINDDLIGKYGKGFKDNTGEVLVTITQTPRRVANISVFFIEGCPGSLSAATRIKEVIAEEGIDVEISLILVETLEDARRLQFTGSPTVRINGNDIETSNRKNKDYGLKSRHYYINGKESDCPTKQMIKDAIKKIN